MNDGLGSVGHPSLVTQTYNSYVVSDKICNALEIGSDQVEIDVASDSVYDAYKNEQIEVNLSFWVGYDKFFWINFLINFSLNILQQKIKKFPS